MKKQDITSPHDGGCWFCHKDHYPLVFDKEWDTYVHVECIREALIEDPSDKEATLMKYLLKA